MWRAAPHSLEKALSLSPDPARAHFFYSGVLRQEGTTRVRRNICGESSRSIRVDRVAVTHLGRVLFLQRKYADAVESVATGADD